MTSTGRNISGRKKKKKINTKELRSHRNYSTVNEQVGSRGEEVGCSWEQMVRSVWTPFSSILSQRAACFILPLYFAGPWFLLTDLHTRQLKIRIRIIYWIMPSEKLCQIFPKWLFSLEFLKFESIKNKALMLFWHFSRAN